MDNADKIALRVLIVYLLGAFLTFGWSYNRVDCLDSVYRNDPNGCRFDKEAGSVFKGLIWPIYISGKIAIYVTTPIF